MTTDLSQTVTLMTCLGKICDPEIVQIGADKHVQCTAGRTKAKVAVTLSVVEVYPYVPYIQFLLPGTIVMAIFVSAMIGGGIIFIDDKARGLHEGYLVTPITKLDLILGFNLAGAIKAVLSALVLVTVGSRRGTDSCNIMH
jgi:hypothetical protein